MSEFLKNLRSSQSVYSNGNRKTFDSYYHPNRERRKDYGKKVDNRRKPPRDSNQANNLLTEVMPLIMKMGPKIMDMIERIASAREKMVQSEERKTTALEEISVTLTKIMAARDFFPPNKDHGISGNSQDKDKDFIRVDKDTAHRSFEENRNKVIDIIQEMRNENRTYDHIAHYLTEQQFPTFSHRGEWHAQTVHRLFKKGRIER